MPEPEPKAGAGSAAEAQEPKPTGPLRGEGFQCSEQQLKPIHVPAAVARFRCYEIACPRCREGKRFKVIPWHCVEGGGGGGDGSGGNAMLVMAVAVMRGVMP